LKRSNRLVLLIGIFLAIVAFVLVVLTLQPSSTPQQAEATKTTYVVATKDLPLGSVITDDAVQEVPIDIVDYDSTTMYKLKSLVVGQTVRAPVTNGQAITPTVLSGSAGAIQNIEVPPGHVAMAVQVDQVSGVGTIIKPGDYVDAVTGITGADKVPLVAAGRGGPTKVPGDLYNPTTVKTLAQGLQVLGTLLPPQTQNGTAPASGAPDNGGVTLNGQQQIVILSLTAQQVEVMKFVQIDGSVSLVLRSTKDCVPAPSPSASPAASPSASPAPSAPAGCPLVATTGITLRGLVDDYGVLAPQVVEVIQPSPLATP
jgi:pilus assembly protein CpaB